MTHPQHEFPSAVLLQYLGLAEDYEPSPNNSPIGFLSAHVRQLPPHLLVYIDLVTTPKDRTVVTVIRNRRAKWAESRPDALAFTEARSTWPTLWQGRERRGQAEGDDEREWAKRGFLKGETKQLVGKLDKLLGEYEEEREAERVRVLRRAPKAPAPDEFVPEEDSDSDDEAQVEDVESGEDAKLAFERLIREKFIYGLLDSIDYNAVDWDESLDEDDDRDAEERYFDDSD